MSRTSDPVSDARLAFAIKLIVSTIASRVLPPCQGTHSSALIHQSPADPAARTGAAGKARAVGMCKKKAQTKAAISPSSASP
jgi:hypothetical protein